MCKKVVFVVSLCMSTLSAYSQATVDSVTYNHKCIALRQNFKGEGSHCMPSFGYSEIYYNVTEDVLKDILSEMIHNTGHFPINISEHLRNHLSEYVLNDKINKYDTIIPIHLTFENDNFFNNDDTIKKITVRSYIDNMENDGVQTFDYCIEDLKIGENKLIERASDPCYNKWNDFHGGHRNSYTLTTSLIYDVPISVEITNTKTDFNIDKNDKVRLKFGDFYKQANDEVALQYQINDSTNNKWKDIATTVPISPNGEVEFMYGDIIQSDDYDKGIGKFIAFRVIKKMVDGTYTSANESNNCRFYLSVPDFTIVESRRPACDDTQLQLLIKVDDNRAEIFNNLLDKTGCSIKIVHDKKYYETEIFNEKGTAFYLSEIKVSDPTENIYSVSAESTEGNEPDLEQFLQDPNATKGLWKIQIEMGDNLYAAEQYFRMPAKLPAIKIDTIQNDASSFADANNPYVRLRIRDDDTTRIRKRLSYDVECWDGADNYVWIHPINSPIDTLTEEEAKEKFNEENSKYSFYKYNSGDPTKDKEDFIKDKFYEWYEIENEKNSLYTKTIKIDKNGYERASYDDSWEPKPNVVSARNYIILGKEVRIEDESTNAYETYTYLYRINTQKTDEQALLVVFKGKISDMTFNDCYNGIQYLIDGNGTLWCDDINGNRIEKQAFRINSGVTLEYLGKGNAFLYVRLLEGGTDYFATLEINGLSFSIRQTGLSVYDFKDFKDYRSYVLNSNTIAHQHKQGGTVLVSKNNNVYNTLDYPSLYSIQELGNGFTYLYNNQKFFRRYNPFSKEELYEYFKTNQVINCPSNSFDNAWNEFLCSRNKYWQEYLKDKNSYKITNIPQKDHLNKTVTSQLAFSGKMRIKDSDGCYSDTVDYVYKYYDLSYDVTIKKLPTSPVAKNGEVELSFSKGALAPYKCYKSNCSNAPISSNFSNTNTKVTIKNIGYNGDTLLFVDSKTNKPDTITRKIEIKMPFDCSATPQTCPNKGGIITIEKTSSFLNPDSIIIKCGNKVCSTISNPAFNNSKEEITGIPLGDYDVVAFYVDYQVQLNNQKIQVSDQSFSISRQNFPAEEIGGSGKVTITAKKADGDIKFTWVDDLGNTTYSTINSNTSTSYTKVSSDNLKITVTHNNCSVTTDYSYESPKINFTKAEITYNENTKKATFDIISSGNNLIDNYTLYLLKDNGQKTATNVRNNSIVTLSQNGTTEFSYEWNTSYYLYAVYNSEKVIVLSNEIIPKELKCNAVAEANNSMRCYGTDGIITLTGEDCEYSTNGGAKYKPFSNNGKISLATGSYMIDFRKISTADLNYCSAEDTIKQITQTTIKTIKNVTITEALPLEYDIIAPNIKCHGADGTISIKVTANAHGDVVFAIRNDDGTISDFSDSITNLSPNIYNIVIQDGYCKDYPYYVDSIEISQPDEPLEFKSITTTDPTCWNDDGKIEVVVKGGWNDLEKCYNISLHEQKNYDTTTVNRYNPDYVVPFEKLKYGKYTIYATDYENCTISEDVTLNKYINPHVTSAIFDSVTCYGWNDGVIDTIKFETDCKVDGEPLELFCTKETGAPSNTANWIEYSPSIKNLTAGGYNIWLKDTNQCVSDEPFHIKVEQPDSLILSITAEDTIIREYGKPGGSVNVNVSGGNKGTFNIYLDSKEDSLTQVIWGNHAFNDIFTPGTHKLYVVDHKKCIDFVETGYMRQPDSPLSIEATPHDALCNGSFGSITVRGSGGWNGYQYSCSSKSNLYGANQNEYTFYDIKGGYYEVSVTDAEGVTATQKVYVNTPPKLMAVPLLRASSCKNDGLISANITGGTMPYLVKPDSSSVTPFYFEPYITNSNLTIIPKQLAAGDYSIVVVDSNNCEILMSATIADSSVKAMVKPVYPTAHEFANGRLEAVVQQGPAPYTYQWKNHNTGETCTNAVWDKVGAGVYSLDVTDANNCSVSVPITYLATNGDLPLIIDTIIGETAVGACNGMAKFTSDTTGFKSITLHGNSGVEKDVTSLVNNKLQFELTDLAPDSYLLECVLADTTVRYAKFTIARYEPMHLIVSNIVDVSKQDAANGSAKLRIDGGRAPFIVQMLRGDDFLADTVLNDRNLSMSGLTAANYTVSVVDESDNRINTQFIIRKPEKPLRLLAQSVENPSCNGYTNGRIILKATGGWGDYEYAAAEGEFGRAIAYDGRGAAVHTFVAIDSKGITDTLKVELVEPLPLTARVVQVDSVSCFGLTDGSVTFDIAGGTAPYTVHYDDFFDKKSNFVGSLNAGTHTFNITDSNFCRVVEGSLAVDVPQPDVLQVARDSVIHTTCNTDNGRIFITIAGGTAPYANSWREDGLIKERFTNLIAIDSLQGYSLYEVEVADAKGCKTGKSYRINPSSRPKIERVRTLPVLCYGDSTGTAVIDSADIVPATPYSPFRIEWPHGENAMSVYNLPAGWNVVFIIDSNNCKNSTSFNIDAPSPIGIRKIGSRDASCYGYADGRISTLTLGGVGGYRYLWSNGDTLPDIDSIAKGAYTIVVADRNNCHDTATFSISQPDSLHVEIGEENVFMCPNNTYEFIPTDGFKTYRWILNDSTLSDKRNLIASEQGEYHLVATYGANCISRDTVTITIGDNLLEADFYMASDASKDNTIALVELSNMKTDSIRWDFSAADFEVMDSSLYELQLKPNTIGLHNITLWAYSSGCVSYITKQVEISELPDTTDNIKLGYDPLIKSVTVKPNPTNGLFGVDVQLRESHDAEMTISSVSHGTQIEQRELTGEAEYSESFDLSNASDGVYILRISASDEHRVLKVLIAK